MGDSALVGLVLGVLAPAGSALPPALPWEPRGDGARSRLNPTAALSRSARPFSADSLESHYTTLLLGCKHASDNVKTRVGI